MLSYNVVGTNVTMYESIQAGGHQLGAGVNVESGVICEVVLSFMLVTVMILNLVDTSARNPQAPFMTGVTLAVAVIIG